VFPEIESPTLVPEEIDEETPLPVTDTEVTEVAVRTTMVERVTVSEHFLAVEYVPVHSAGAPRPPTQQSA
jgi:hypothetical protein